MNNKTLYKVVGKKNGQLVEITELPMTFENCLKWTKEQGIDVYYNNVDIIPYHGSKPEFKLSKN